MASCDKWTSPVFALFFVISGAELELGVFTEFAIVFIGIIYIVFRSFGKYFGTFFSAKLTKCEPNICKYLGITLLPQAGVALGMAIKVKDAFDGTVNASVGTVVANITLFSVLLYELIGPYLTKISLLKAGEIEPEGAISARELEKEKQQNKA